MRAQPDHSKRTTTAPKKKQSLGARVLQKINQDHNKARENNKIALRNLQLSLAALVSITAAFILAVSTTSFDGYINTSDTGQLIQPRDLSRHDDVTLQHVMSYSVKSIQECLTFTYLTPDYKIHGCLDDHFTVKGRDDFGALIQAELLDPNKAKHFDLLTRPVHAPAQLKSETKHIAGRAAWKLHVPFELTLNFHDRNPFKQTWLLTIWIVREQPTIRPSGLAIHSVAMERA